MDRSTALLTLDQVCEKLHISRWTVGRWIASGKLAAKKAGRRVLVPETEVNRLLAGSNLAFTRGLPASPSWFAQVNPELVNEGAELIAAVLRKSGVNINADGLKPIIMGDETPTPVFWNTLIVGLRRMLTPTENALTSDTQPTVEDYVKDWRDRGGSGNLWNQSTRGDKPLHPSSKNEDDEKKD